MDNVTINDILFALLVSTMPLVLRYIHQLVAVKVADSQWASAVEAVFSAVEYVNQTYVDALKAEGRFDKPAQATAMALALSAAKELMTTNTRNWLQAAVGDMDDWLAKQIESAVKAAKN